MAEGDDGQEKNEEPTEKRRQDARKDGQIVTSTEVFVLVTLTVGALMFVVGRSALPGITGLWAQGFIIAPDSDIDALMMARAGNLLVWTVIAGAGLGLPLLLTVLTTQAGIGGLNFAPKAMMPKMEKVSPIKGLKRMVSMRALVELTKAVLKVVLLLTAGLYAVWPMFTAFEAMSTMPPSASIVLMGEAVLRLIAGVLCGLLLIAGLDLAWQIHSNTKQLRMSRQELKDEHKESEGAPEQKMELRKRQREASQRATERKALVDVPTATAIITNPSHFAVALRYDRKEGTAPVIVAMGKGPIAREVIRRGRLASVKTFRIPPLSRALYFSGAIGREIPEELYAAVAILLAHVWRLDQGMHEGMPAIDLPPELQLDEFGRPQNRK